jgi:hypothetical protein
MSATLSGSVMQDMTGNGLTADDKPLSGVVVKLYKDLNGNGKLDSTDGAAVASKTSAATTGAYSFTGLPTGKYLLQETPGTNQLRTAPVLSSTIAVNASKNQTYGNNVFANYIKNFDKSAGHRHHLHDQRHQDRHDPRGQRPRERHGHRQLHRRGRQDRYPLAGQLPQPAEQQHQRGADAAGSVQLRHADLRRRQALPQRRHPGLLLPGRLRRRLRHRQVRPRRQQHHVHPAGAG